MKRGLFITFEGIEGSGKSTQYRSLAEAAIERALAVKALREPGGTRIGDKIRALLLDPDHEEMMAETEALLYAASRAQLVSQVIEKSLGDGEIVICDRYLDSSIAYQVFGRGLSRDFVLAINERAEAAVPDLTILLDIEASVGLARATAVAADRIEREAIDFHRRVREGYLTIAREEPDRFRVFDGALDRETLSKNIWREVEALLKESDL